MTPSQLAAFKRGLTDADTTRVARHPSRPRLVVAAVSMALSMVVTLPFAVTAAADRGIDEAVTEGVHHEGLAMVALTDGPAPAADAEVAEVADVADVAEVVEPGVEASPADGSPEAPTAPPREEAAAAAPGPCAEALSWVADAGLPLPEGVGYHCPSTQFPHHGAACWHSSPCLGRGFIAVNLELIGDATPEYLRHVVAHEICHILDFQARGWSTEAGADACAAAHGA